MMDDFIMYTATALYFICYAPSVYADFRNKNANVYNVPEKIISLCATTLGFVYSYRIQNIPLMVNYGPHLLMETVTLLFKIQYVQQNCYNTESSEPCMEDKSSITNNPIHPSIL